MSIQSSLFFIIHKWQEKFFSFIIFVFTKLGHEMKETEAGIRNSKSALSFDLCEQESLNAD